MKSIFISLLFFFGPVLLMFALRYLGLMLRIWLLWRQQKKHGKDVIDITPRTPHPPSIRFIIFAVVTGLMISGLIWYRLTDEDGRGGVYVPAYTDNTGNLVPGHFRNR